MCLAIALVASQHVGLNLITGFDFESIEANVEFSGSATEQQKSAFIGHLEETLVDTRDVHADGEQQNILGWTAKYNRAEFDSDRINGEQFAAIAVQYAFEEERSAAPTDFADTWRNSIQRPAYVERLTIGVGGGANNGNADISFILSGKDIESLKAGAEELSNLLASYPGVSNVTDNLPYGREQIIFEISPQGQSLGLTTSSIGTQLRAAYSGARVQIFNERDNELEVRVMLPDYETG